MANLLGKLGVAGAVWAGFQVGRNVEYEARRKRELAKRSDIEYEQYTKPKLEREKIEGTIKTRTIQEEDELTRGAREAEANAISAAEAGQQADYAAQQDVAGSLATAEPSAPATKPQGAMLSGVQPGGGEQATGTAPGAPAGGAPSATTPTTPTTTPTTTPAQKQANPVKLTPWMVGTNAKIKYYMSKGRPDKAREAMLKSLQYQYDVNEAEWKYKMQPIVQEGQAAQLKGQAINAKAGLQDAQFKQAGLLWGMVLAKDIKGAVQRFNDSQLVAPGVRATDVKFLDENGNETQDGSKVALIALVGPNGKPVPLQDGQPAVYPRELLDAGYLAATTNVKELGKDKILVAIGRDPRTGLPTTSGKPLATNVSGTEKRANAKELRDQKKDQRARTKAGTDAVDGLTVKNKGMLEQVSPETRKIQERGHEIVTKMLADDPELDPQVAGTRAVKQAREEIAAEKGKGKGKGEPEPRAKASPEAKAKLKAVIEGL